MSNETKDGYELFFEYFFEEYDEEKIIKKLWDFGLNNMHVIDKNSKVCWEELCKKICDAQSKDSDDEPIVVRTYGNKGAEDRKKMLISFYKFIFGEEFNIATDSTGNTQPKKILREYTDYSVMSGNKKCRLRNYQISHVFGKTRNCYAYTAPWNIIYLPKILDPFTGHESKGNITTHFSEKLQHYMLQKYRSQIVEFNEKMDKIAPKIKKFKQEKKEELLSIAQGKNPERIVNEFFKRIDDDFKKIEINNK